MEMGPAVSRSSLELMLDSIRLRDERPEVVPPALPARPTSRGRLPSSRRPLLPVKTKAAPDLPPKGCGRREEKEVAVFESGLSGPEPPYLKMPELESYEDTSEEDGGTGSPPDANLGWDGTADHLLKKIVAAEDTRNQTLQGILVVQQRFHGHQARCSFQELKRGVTTLQSFVRGETARCGFEYLAKRWKSAVLIQKHVKRWIARKTFDVQRKDLILLQSVIRGWLARRDFMALRNLEMRKASHVKVNRDPGNNLQEMKDTVNEHPQVCPSVLAQLQRRVLQAESELRHKEEENSVLRQQLEQYETRWSEYEVKMKSMEETWQNQLTSLQMSLATAKKSLVVNDMASQPGRLDASSNHLYFDSEDTMSAGTHIPEGTPAKQSCSSDARLSRNSDGTRNAVIHLVEEFEQRRQVFEDNAGLFIEVKSGKSDSTMNPNEELQKLKVRFDAWRKNYKVRLRETKASLQKLGNSEPKAWKRWWALASCTR